MITSTEVSDLFEIEQTLERAFNHLLGRVKNDADRAAAMWLGNYYSEVAGRGDALAVDAVARIFTFEVVRPAAQRA